MNLVNKSLDHYINLLATNQKFSFTRWGDGEWSCLFGAEGQNCDKHIYFPKMANGLAEVFQNHKGYFLATWSKLLKDGSPRPMMKNILPSIEEFLQINDLTFDWVDATVWEEAAMAGEFSPLVRQLEKMNFVIVSESSKRELPIKYTDFIDVPAENCFLEKDSIKEQMIQMCKKYDNVVFGLSASMATNVIVDELYPVIGDKCWMIDFGSVWEPYVPNPVHVRSYHNRYKTKELI